MPAYPPRAVDGEDPRNSQTAPYPGEKDPLKRLLALGVRVRSRREGDNGDYPALLSVAAGLANGHEGCERECAVHASKTIIRPLAEGNGGDYPASPA